MPGLQITPLPHRCDPAGAQLPSGMQLSPIRQNRPPPHEVAPMGRQVPSSAHVVPIGQQLPLRQAVCPGAQLPRAAAAWAMTAKTSARISRDMFQDLALEPGLSSP